MEWVKLGIVPERSRPASPQDNGRHERMHSTLKQSTLRRPSATHAASRKPSTAFSTSIITSVRMSRWKIGRRPAAISRPRRPMPRRVPELEYGDDIEVRRVSQQGSVKMRGVRTFISEIFAYEWLGLRALDER